MPEHPESFPVNALVPIEGTPLEKNHVRTKCYVFGTVQLIIYPAPPPHNDSADNCDSPHCFTHVYNKTRSRAADILRE